MEGGILNSHTTSLEQKNTYLQHMRKNGILLSDTAMDEDEMLKKAIAMSLEKETGVGFLQTEKTRLSTITFRRHAARDNF